MYECTHITVCPGLDYEYYLSGDILMIKVSDKVHFQWEGDAFSGIISNCRRVDSA